MQHKTDRYIQLSGLLTKSLPAIKCQFQKYGINHGTSKRQVLLVNLQITPEVTIDHLWVTSPSLVSAKLRTNQPITVSGKLAKRTRPGVTYKDEPTLDVQLTKVILCENQKQ